MPMKLPNLDDRAYADLMAEALASIPTLYPRWTDHNPSNPGIALIELFAWLSEMLIYRTNVISENTQDTFLKLIRGPEYRRPAGQDLETAIRETVAELRELYRAVSEDDYEQLTLFTWNASRGAGMDAVARVRCLAERTIDGQEKLVAAPGHVTLLVVPDSPVFHDENAPAYWVDPSAALTNSIKVFFDDRKLLTTRVRVRGPSGVRVRLEGTIFLKDDARRSIRAEIRDALLRHFHPLFGGTAGRGWPWGRAAHPSDVFTVLDELSGVDYVEGVRVIFDGAPEEQSMRFIHGYSVKLLPHELVRLEPDDISFTLMERRGDTWIEKID